MSLPRKEIAIKLLDLYKARRDLDPKPVSSQSLFNTLSKAVERSTKVLVGQASPEYYVQTINSFVSRFETLDTFDNCINLIFELGVAANEAANQKINFLKGTVTSSESLFCKTLHALRDYVLTTLRESEYKSDLEYVLKEIASDQAKLDKQIIDKLTHNSDVSDLNDKRNALLLKRAFLGDVTAIFDASRSHLLDSYVHFSGKNCNMPICFQYKYLKRYFYPNEVKEKLAPSYDAFEKLVLNESANLAQTEAQHSGQSHTQTASTTTQHEMNDDDVAETDDDAEIPSPPSPAASPHTLRRSHG